MKYMCKRFSVMIISYDKMNQLRHVRFLKNKEGVLAHMAKPVSYTHLIVPPTPSCSRQARSPSVTRWTSVCPPATLAISSPVITQSRWVCLWAVSYTHLMLVDEFRACKWGRISLERPPQRDDLADFAEEDEE